MTNDDSVAPSLEAQQALRTAMDLHARGDIDAAIMFPTFFGAAKKTLGDDYREIISDLYVLHMVIAASGNVVEKDPALIEKFVSVLVKADAALKAHILTLKALERRCKAVANAFR